MMKFQQSQALTSHFESFWSNVSRILTLTINLDKTSGPQMSETLSRTLVNVLQIPLKLELGNWLLGCHFASWSDAICSVRLTIFCSISSE